MSRIKPYVPPPPVIGDSSVTGERRIMQAYPSPVRWFIYHRASDIYLDTVMARTAYFAWLRSEPGSKYPYAECRLTTDAPRMPHSEVP